jgi:hypothetical protein
VIFSDPCLNRPSRAQGLRAGTGDVFEHGFLMRGIALDGLNEVGDQIGPPLELDGNTAPCLVTVKVELDQPVIGGPQVNSDDHDDEDDDAWDY